ncbi:MAG: oligoribonuclease [bacterium]|nr:oligoribonuclease [bacterium]
MQRTDLLVWMDLELTSIADALTDRITEIAIILTNKDLNVVAEGPDIIIHVDDKLFDTISPDARAIHDANGMQALVAESTTSAEEAEQAVLAFLREHVAEKSAPLCGNSIHMDRHFLRLQMSSIDQYLFYRCIDVSSVKELARRWAPEVYAEAERRKGTKPHRAKDDVLNSIAELKFYREHFFKA